MPTLPQLTTVHNKDKLIPYTSQDPNFSTFLSPFPFSPLLPPALTVPPAAVCTALAWQADDVLVGAGGLQHPVAAQRLQLVPCNTQQC